MSFNFIKYNVKKNCKIEVQKEILRVLLGDSPGELNVDDAHRHFYNCRYKNHAANVLVHHGIEDGNEEMGVVNTT